MEIPYNISFVNIDNQIEIKNVSQNNDLIVDKNTDYKVYVADSEKYFSGTALSLSLNCEVPTDCGNTVFFENRVQR